jgi:hypothetical protein
MWRLWFAFLLATAAFAVNIRLYLKDGDFHIVREYKVEGDRVRYYSVERQEWEEIPLDLVDLKKTEAEIRAREQAQKEEAAAMDAEEKAERAARREIERVPLNPGVYLVDGEKLISMKQAEVKLASSKGRSVLKVLTPAPIVPGKVTAELDGETSGTVLTNPNPEFYIRLRTEERFGIAKLAKKKGVRIVDQISVAPVTNEKFEEIDLIETFRRHVDEGLYKIWPQKPLPPGEYAVVEYTEGQANIQVWDFTIR